MATMGGLAVFVDELFRNGSVRLERRPEASPADRDEAVARLRAAYEDDALDLPGPALPFEPAVATAAAEWTHRACWFLVSRSDPGELMERALAPPSRPTRPGHHLAADLTFRYLPLVYRRARATSTGDLLTTRLAEVLRQWPLSGVLSDVHDEPTTPLDFGGHPGLLMLYAERLTRNEKPAWIPAEGSVAVGYFDLVRGVRPSNVREPAHA